MSEPAIAEGHRAQQPSAQLFEPPEHSNAGLQAALGRNGARIQRQRCRRQGGPGPTRARLRAGRFCFAVPKPWQVPSFPDIGRTGHCFAGRQRRYQIPAGNGGGRSDRTDRASRETTSRFITNSLQVTTAGRSRQWFGAVPAARVWAARQCLPSARGVYARLSEMDTPALKIQKRRGGAGRRWVGATLVAAHLTDLAVRHVDRAVWDLHQYVEPPTRPV
jgi:hypothetical protein